LKKQSGKFDQEGENMKKMQIWRYISIMAAMTSLTKERACPTQVCHLSFHPCYLKASLAIGEPRILVLQIPEKGAQVSLYFAY
jgi:hypothetical protein